MLLNNKNSLKSLEWEDEEGKTTEKLLRRKKVEEFESK